MNERIVFTTPAGSVCVVIPTGDVLKEYNIEVIDSSDTINISTVNAQALSSALVSEIAALVPVDETGKEYMLMSEGMEDSLFSTREELVNDIMAKLSNGVSIFSGVDTPDELVGDIKVSEVVFTVDEILDKVIAKDVPAGATNVRKITVDELPEDRLFREAWDDSNSENFIGLNFDKAKGIAHGLRRDKRDEVFAPNIAILTKNASGIPLAANESATDAAAANAAYKTDIDDVAQIDIDEAVDETELRVAMV